MPSRKLAIEQAERETARLGERITSECVEIGKRLSALAPGEVARPELKKYLVNIRTLRKSIDDVRTGIARLEELFRRAGELRDRMEDNQRRIRELARERGARMTELGAGAYSLFRRLQNAERFAPLFDEVLKLDVEMDNLSSELATAAQEEKDKGFFERLKLKTKKVMIRGEISRVERLKLKAYAAAGEQAAAGDFARLAGGDLAALFGFAAGKRAEIEALRAENMDLDAEHGRIRQELREQGCEEGIEIRRKETEDQVRGIEKELDVMYCWTGQLYVEKNLRGEIPDEAILAKFEIIGGMRESIRRNREQVHKLRAELEMKGLRREEQALLARRRHLEEEKRAREQEIAAIDARTEAGRGRMEELRKALSGEAPYSEPSPDEETVPEPGA